MELRELDAIQLELLDHLVKRFFVGNAYEDDGGRRRIGALGERVGHIKCRVVRLDDLLRQAEVLADEQIEVRAGTDLRHIQHGGRKRRICQELFLGFFQT